MATEGADALTQRIVAKGDEVRQLKTANADKEAVNAAVAELLSLKNEYKQLTGQDYQAPGAPKKEKKKDEKPKEPKDPNEKSKKQLKKEAKKAEKADKKKEAHGEASPYASPGSPNKTPTENAAKASAKKGAEKPSAAAASAQEPLKAIASQIPAPESSPEIRFTADNLPLATFIVGALSDPNKGTSCFRLIPGHKVIAEMAFPSGEIIRGDANIARYLAMQCNDLGLYGHDALSTSVIEQWLDFGATYLKGTIRDGVVSYLDQVLLHKTFLVGYSTTLADIAVWSYLTKKGFKTDDKYPHLGRWLRLFNSISPFSDASEALSSLVQAMQPTKESSRVGGSKPTQEGANGGSQKGKTTGNCPPLPGAVEGKVCTRFPPEPSGYLHIGHIKAAMLNNYYARLYKGKLRLRFDDTNPSKEKMEFEQSIIEDLKRMNIVPDEVTYTSDYFPQMKDYAIKMIKSHKAYMDDTPVEKMREERMDGIESARRTTSAEENLKIFEELCKGNPDYIKYCLRAKIDMQAKNKTLRDPVLYRFNDTPHHRHGTKYKAYPTYDFACPIVDSLEGVTHALRTTEYNDRDAQYQWVIEALGIRPVQIVAFARLNFVHTVLSKRKLTWFVENKHVEGWNDPRFPTIQGVLRRGVQVEALREFILGQGFSKRIVDMEWDKFWAINKKYVDPVAPRYAAIVVDTAVELRLTNVPNDVQAISVPLHPKNPDLGRKVLRLASSVWLEGDDAKDIVEGEEITLMKWGNAIVSKVQKNADGSIAYLEGTSNPSGDVKATKKKLTWVAKLPDVPKVTLVEFDHIVTKAKLEEGDSVEDFVNKHSRAETVAYADHEVRNLNEDTVIQFERRGYFRVDRPHMSDQKPAVLFMVPDGKAKAMSTLSTKLAHR